MQKANPEIEDKLKKYKRGQSMGDYKKLKARKNLPTIEEKLKIIEDDVDDDHDLSPRAKSIHIIMRPDEEDDNRKVTE